MLNIFLASIASSIIFFGSGTITNYIIFRKTISELSNFDKGIFGAIFIAFCSLFINGRPHGPDKLITTCQLHMRKFKDGDIIYIEPFYS